MRLKVRAPHLTTRRPVHATRAVGELAPVEYSKDRLAPLWLVIGAGVLGAAVLAEFIYALSVLS